MAIRLQALDRKVNVPGTFGLFRSDQAHAQGEAQSSESFLARWNRPKLVLQTVAKLAIRLQALDRKQNLPRTFWHFRSDQAHAQGEAQSSKSFLALWDRPKLVLQTLGKLAIRLRALDRKVNVPVTFGHLRAAAWKTQTSPDSLKKSTSILFNKRNPYIELFSKMEFKRSSEFHFSRNREMSAFARMGLGANPKIGKF